MRILNTLRFWARDHPRLKSLAILSGLSLLLAAALMVSFWNIVAEPENLRFLLAGDAWSYAGPNLFFMDHVIHHFHEFPMWNPLMLSGHPFAGNPQSFVFYPPNLLRSLLTFDPTPVKTHTGINTMIFLHLLFAGVTTFYLGRRHALSMPASFVAATAFMLSSASTVRAIGHWYFHNSVTWLPLLLLLANFGLRSSTSSRQTRWFLLTGLVYGLVLLGGFLQLTMLIGITLGAYVLLLRLTGAANAGASNQSTESTGISESDSHIQPIYSRVPRIPLDLMLLGLVCLLGILVSAPMFLPVQEFAAQSGRVNVESIDWGEKELAFDWGLFKQLVVYSGDWRYESIKGAGAGVLILACFSLFNRRRRDAITFAVIFAILLEASTENSVFLGKVLDIISPIHLDEPGRAMIIADLALAMCAGFGLDALLRPLESRRLKMLRTALLAGVGAVILPVLWQGVHPHPVIDVFPLAFIFPAALAAALIPAGWIRYPTVFGAAAAILIASEVVSWNFAMLHRLVGEKTKHMDILGDIDNPQTFWDDNHRLAYDIPNTHMYKLNAAINGYDPVEIESVRKVITIKNLEGVYTREVPFIYATALNQRGNLFLKRSFWLARQYVRGPLPPRDRYFPPTTTVYLDTPPGLDLPVPRVAPNEVPSRSFSAQSQISILFNEPDNPIVLLPNDDTLIAETASFRFSKSPHHASLNFEYQSDGPLTLIVAFLDPTTGRVIPGFRHSLESTQGKSARLELPAPDFEDTVCVLQTRAEEGRPEFRLYQVRLAVDLSDEFDLIEIVRRTANSVELNVGPLPEPRILNFIDAYYPGWTAAIDGERVPILRSNDAFKAVVVPAGTHTINFDFRPRRVVWGLLISLNTIAIVAIALVVLAIFGDSSKRD